jgi:trimeric autotransporter adhesin
MRVLRIAAVFGLLSGALLMPSAAAADPGDIGHVGPSYAGLTDPTAEKPESKLWFNDGTWWGSLWDTASNRYEIHRLNTGTQTWVSSNVAIDGRSTSRADALWDGAKLYVASHVAGSPAGNNPANLYRYSYSSATDTYTLDPGFPQLISNQRSESLVIDKDSTGQLWATWTQNGSNGREVWVNRTTSGDSGWGTPFELPVNGTNVDNDDISSVIAFGGNRIGVFWSNQKGSSFHFAVHDDAAADTTWGSSVGVFPGAGNADDHINLKSLLTDGSGRVFAVVKTSRTGGSDPSIVLLERSTSAVWTPHTIWTKGNDLTRPIVLLDTTNNRVHAFAAKESGGPIYTKTSPLSSIGFASGLGTTVMLDASHDDLNNPTSTKQNVTSTTGLVVLASNDSTERYWHHHDSLGGGGGPTGPTANFSASPTSGSAPLAVTFSDTSSGAPTSWAWDFDDNGSVDSTLQNPSHSYDTPGTYSVRLTVTNADGSDAELKTDYISVSDPGGGGDPVTVAASDDTYVSSSAPSSVFGNATELRVRQSSSTQLHSYLKFTVAGAGSPTSATLRLFVTEASVDGGSLFLVPDSSWSESSMTWSTKKVVVGAALDSAGTASVGTWVEFDVSDAVNGDGTYSFALISAANDVVRYASSEHGTTTNRPQLVLAGSGGGGPTGPTANFSASPTSGSAPLAVTFSDTSSGAPTSWAWDFDDNGSVDSTLQNPSHSYDTPGTYSVRLTVTNADGSDAELKTDYISVSDPGGGGDPVTVAASDDTYVSSSAPSSVFGNATELRVRQSSSTQLHSYLKFTVAGAGSPTSATLRLFVTEASVDGGSLFLVPDSSWSESSMTWSTKKVVVGAALDSAGTASVGTWVEFDVSDAVNGDGTYSFALISAANDVVRYASSEHGTTTNRPQLVLAP